MTKLNKNTQVKILRIMLYCTERVTQCTENTKKYKNTKQKLQKELHKYIKKMNPNYQEN